MTAALKAPFPYFGGKSRVAHVVWDAFGNPKNYIEPFFGSGATLLSRPAEHLASQPIETVNDADGLLANFWRSMNHDPEAVIIAAENPVNEADLHARHLWLVRHRDSITLRLMADPDWCDPKAAGWWVWGICCWIGSGWCSGNGPWTEVDGVFARHLSSAGQGVNRQLPHLGNAGQGLSRQRYWLETVIDRLLNVRVSCGDWSRVVTNSVIRVGSSTAIFLDPPYSVGSEYYATGKSDVREDVRKWCEKHGDDPRLRIALCGYEGEHDLPGWTVHKWKAKQAYASSDTNSRRERIWFSPHCLPIAQVKTEATE